MKTLFTLVISFITITNALAQQGINYKAVIKDNGGNVIANQTIDVQFTIYEGAALTNNVYQENHDNITTDANGIIILNIGNGSTSDVFTNIAWNNDEHWLNVQVDIGSGLVDLGTTQFMAVPYALNVSGLESLDEGNGLGWRLKGRNPANYGDLGDGAIDFSASGSASSTQGGTGVLSFATGTLTTASGVSSTAMGDRTIASNDFATALGKNTIASGISSTAIGQFTTASAVYATAMGENTTASGARATAMGENTTASGNVSTAIGNSSIASGFVATAMGDETTALSYAETVIGKSNTTYSPLGTGSWNDLDRLFVVGNGNTAPSDALIVLKNGAITAPSLDLNEITDNKSLTTKAYVDLSATGLEFLNEGNGSGWRLKGRNPDNYGNIDSNAIDLSYSLDNTGVNGATNNVAVAFGLNTRASGNTSTAMGNGTMASASNSTAMGFDTTASANNATAIGYGSIASGGSSTAMGFFTEAIGDGSTAMGSGTIAASYVETVLGSYNSSSLGDSDNWVPTQPLLIVGNGMNGNNRRNALTILKNGKVSIGTNSFNGLLNLKSDSNSNVPHIELTETTANDGARISFKNELETANTWTLYGRADNSNASSEFNIFYSNTAGNIMSLRGNGDVYVNGSLAHSSDRRLKKDIKTLPYGLNDILQLEPKAYFWKDKPEQKRASLGLIAQDVQKIISNVVHTGTDEKKTLSISYTELIPVLINAMKEQQTIIENQAIKINGLSAELADKNGTLKHFNVRLKQIESLLEVNK